MKKFLLIFIAALLMLTGCAARENTITAADRPDYPLLSDEEYYPEGYIGYKYPIRPYQEEWLRVKGDKMKKVLRIPKRVLKRMSTEELAQTALRLPIYE